MSITPLKIIGAVLFVLLLLAVLAVTLAGLHVDRIWGGRVDRVQTAALQVEAERIAITNVSVLSPTGDEMLTPRTIILDQGGIEAVSLSDSVSGVARVIDGTDLYAMPGLIDAHVHLRRQPNDLLLYIANGVTHVRDLSGSTAILNWRDEVERGERIGPRITAASPLLYTTSLVRGWFRGATEPRQNIMTPAGASNMVRWLQDQGYDALKLYADIDPDVFRAVNIAAREAGLHTVGHLPFDFTLDDLEELELREVAHIEEFIKKLQDEFDSSVHGPYSEAFPSFVADQADAVIDVILERDLTVNTTLSLMERVGNQVFDLRSELARLPLQYANPGMIEGSAYVQQLGWLPGRNVFEQTEPVSPEQRAAIEASWEARAEAHRILFRRMVERNVRLTIGTDATSHLMIPGFSIHQELESLVRNGMTPGAALRAAGATPAELMNINGGVIAPGRRADLVLLSANPLLNITNTTAIEAVIAQGRFYDRDALDSMLESVEHANNESRTIGIDEFIQ
jgi:imidazolonepropionase-like amidohydrolase